MSHEFEARCLRNPCMTVMLKMIEIQKEEIYSTLTRFIISVFFAVETVLKM